MNTGFTQIVHGEQSSDQGRRLVSGVVIGVVTNNGDPDGLGRVKVKYPWLSGTEESFWARVAAPMAGNDRGAYFLPEVNDEVLIAFDRGDMRFPYMIGALWNGRDKVPVDNSDGKNNLRMIKSRSGHVIKLNDAGGKETVEIIDASGQNRIVVDTANHTITLTAGQDIVLSAPKGTIKLTARGIEIQSTGAAQFTTGGDMNVTADRTLNLKGSIVNIN